MIRNVIAVISGYAVFAISSVVLFRVAGYPPHQEAPLRFKIFTLFYGLLFSVAAGYVVQLVARQLKLTLNYFLAVIIFLLAAISIVLSKGNSHWTQLFAMLIFSPVSIIGGYLKIRKLIKA